MDIWRNQNIKNWRKNNPTKSERALAAGSAFFFSLLYFVCGVVVCLDYCVVSREGRRGRGTRRETVFICCCCVWCKILWLKLKKKRHLLMVLVLRFTMPTIVKQILAMKVKVDVRATNVVEITFVETAIVDIQETGPSMRDVAKVNKINN